jgi:F-type H+-transporting ATPase subunit b
VTRTRTLLLALLASFALALSAAPAHAAEAEAGETGPATHAAEECIHILEGGGTVDQCQEAPNPILPETNEIIWGGLAFLLLFLVLLTKGIPAIKKAMDERAEKIRQSLDDAERAKQEAEQIKATYEGQLADARTEAARIIEEARQAADAVRRDLITRAEQEAAELRARNAEQVEVERARVLSELQNQVASLALELAERVVQQSLDRESNLALIERYIDELTASGAPRS